MDVFRAIISNFSFYSYNSLIKKLSIFRINGFSISGIVCIALIIVQLIFVRYNAFQIISALYQPIDYTTGYRSAILPTLRLMHRCCSENTTNRHLRQFRGTSRLPVPQPVVPRQKLHKDRVRHFH